MPPPSSEYIKSATPSSAADDALHAPPPPPPHHRPGAAVGGPDVKQQQQQNDDHSPMSSSGSSSRVPPRRRRDKPQLSCNLCRFKKLRCDRQQPCSTCSTRGVACHYVADPATLVNAIDYRPRGRATSAAQDRIRHLERLVISLMEKSDQSDPANSLAAEALLQSQSNSTPPPDPAGDPRSDSALPDELGKLSLSEGATTWVTNSHWAAVLDDIADLREHLEYKEGSSTPDSKSDAYHNNIEPELFYGSNRRATREQILTSVPPRQVADELVATFFNSWGGTYKVVHSRTFLVEYEEFWQSPSRMSVMWLGMLFSMLALAQHFHTIGVAAQAPDAAHQNVPPPQRPYDQPVHPSVQRLRQRAVQCLVLGRYTQPSPRAVEALIVYLALEYMLNPRSDSGIMSLMSTIVRLAMQMGYHRDPSHFPSIKPLEAEMRRRTWISILMLDMNISSQAGVPRILKPWQSDVQEPRNLADEDLDEHMPALPPSRPGLEPTSTLFLIARYRIAAAFGIISDLATSTMQPSYSQILKADQGLLDAHKSIPKCYQPRSAADSVHDPPELIMHRIYIASIFRKAQCVLHRRFLQHKRDDPSFGPSRTTCIKAALALLGLQRAVNEDVQPGRPLFATRWRILTLVNNDFLLGTTIAAAELHARRKEPDAAADATTAELGEALRAAHAIWSSYGTSFPEATRAADAIAVILSHQSPAPGQLSYSPPGAQWQTIPEPMHEQYVDSSPPTQMPQGPSTLFLFDSGGVNAAEAHYIPHTQHPQAHLMSFDDGMHHHAQHQGHAVHATESMGPYVPAQATGGYYGQPGGFDAMFAPGLVYPRDGNAQAYYPMGGAWAGGPYS